jgi:hypothetical protein
MSNVLIRLKDGWVMHVSYTKNNNDLTHSVLIIIPANIIDHISLWYMSCT